MGASRGIGSADDAEYPRWVTLWFTADAVLALFPPIYWAVGSTDVKVGGIGASLLYFVATALFIAASVVAAYLAEAWRGNFDEGALAPEDSPC